MRPRMVVVDEAYADSPARRAHGDDAAARPSEIDGHQDDVQGVRHGRGPARLPRGGAGGGRGRAAGPVALPPVGLTQAAARVALTLADELLGAVQAVRTSATGCVRAGDVGLAVVPTDANFVLFGRLATRRSPGRPCSTAACWSATSACPAGCGSRPGCRRVDAFLGALRESVERRRVSARRARSSGRPRSPTSSSSSALDGTGRAEAETGVPFFDHMLAQLGKHGGFDLRVQTTGDLEVDAHHTIEDTSLALGPALAEALGDKAASAATATPWSRSTRCWCRPPSTCPAGRTWCTTSRRWPRIIGPVYTTMTRHIWESLGSSAKITLHVWVLAARRRPPRRGGAVQGGGAGAARRGGQDPRSAGVPSTKGTL